MPSHLLLANSTPIDLDDPDYEKLLKNLQGNILKHHGRKFSIHLFLEFKNPRKVQDVKQCIARFATKNVTSAWKQQEDVKKWRVDPDHNQLFANFFLSAEGYRFLGFKENELPADDSFRVGRKEMTIWGNEFSPRLIHRLKNKSDAVKSKILSNRGRSKRGLKTWDQRYKNKTIHAMILLAFDEPSDLFEDMDDNVTLHEAADAIAKDFEKVANVFQREFGRKHYHNGVKRGGRPIEHFGFIDGISNPFFSKQDRKKALDQEGVNRFDQYDSWAPLMLALVEDPLGGDHAYGSYLAYEKLEQNVKQFNAWIRDLAKALNVTTDLAEALVMGRFKDGKPIFPKSSPGTKPPLNNFNFAEDPAGTQCPFHAHIRKTNRRAADWYTRIVRRGITYGNRLKENHKFIDEPEKDVGLLFLSFQSSIEAQFERITRLWAEEDSPRQGVGSDPIIGQESRDGESKSHQWPSQGGGTPESKHVKYSATPFITEKGGEYFFAPSISFLTSLGGSRKRRV